MIPLPEGTLRYSPRDLVAYLEGDFAAWCDLAVIAAAPHGPEKALTII